MLGAQRFLGQFRRSGLGAAETDHFRYLVAIGNADENIAGLEITMDHAFRVRMLHRMAHLLEQLQSLGRVQTLTVAVRSDRTAVYVLHHKIWPATVRGAGVEYLGDVR